MNRAQAPSDQELVNRALRGDLAAFDELVRRYQRQATGIAYRLLTNRDDAIEVTQDAFLRAFYRLTSLEEPGRFGSWLLRILCNLALNRRRARALRRASSLDAPSPQDGPDQAAVQRPDQRVGTPLEHASAEDLRRFLWNAIDALPDMQRQALILFSIEKLPQKDVAEILQCSVEAVKWNVFMARKKLKDKLDSLG